MVNNKLKRELVSEDCSKDCFDSIPLRIQCKKTTTNVDIALLPGGDFIMTKKGQNFMKYSKEKKMKAVQMYLNGKSVMKRLRRT